MSRLSEYPTKVLLGYLTLEYMNWHYNHGGKEEIEWEIRDELSKRPKDVPILLGAFAHPADSFQQRRVTEALCELDDPTILQAFTAHPCTGDDRTTWYCLNYRANRGDAEALRILNDNYFDYPVSSQEWSETVPLFGEFKYRPAIPNLISSLDAASLNLVGAALYSLKKLFPGPHPDFRSLAEAKEYFQKLYESDL